MIRAAASGRVDFSTADSDSVQWRVRERLVLRAIEREAVLDLNKLRHAQMVGSLAWPDFDTRGHVYKYHFDAGKALVDDVENLLLPYDKVDKKEYYKREMEEAKAQYTAAFGDPTTPEAKEQARRDATKLTQQRLEAKQRMQNEMEMKRRQADRLAEIRARRSRRAGRG